MQHWDHHYRLMFSLDNVENLSLLSSYNFQSLSNVWSALHLWSSFILLRGTERRVGSCFCLTRCGKVIDIQFRTVAIPTWCLPASFLLFPRPLTMSDLKQCTSTPPLIRQFSLPLRMLTKKDLFAMQTMNLETVAVEMADTEYVHGVAGSAGGSNYRVTMVV